MTIPTHLIAAALATSLALAACDLHKGPDGGAFKTAASPTASAQAPHPCEANQRQITEQYEHLMAQGEPWKAFLEAARCAKATGSQHWSALEQKAVAADRQLTIANPKASAAERLQAIDSLRTADSRAAEAHAALYKRLQKQEAAALAKLKRSQGVSIGMSQQDVRASSWGKPERVNRSHYAFGDREQWVYGGGNYLYFQNDTLTSIQTSR